MPFTTRIPRQNLRKRLNKFDVVYEFNENIQTVKKIRPTKKKRFNLIREDAGILK